MAHGSSRVLERVCVRSRALMVEAFERESSWEDGVFAGLEALLVFLDAEPALARVCLVEALAGPPVALRLSPKANKSHTPSIAPFLRLVLRRMRQSPDGRADVRADPTT
jgi:hypothetical protein